MSGFDRRRRLILVIVFAAASIAIIFGVRHIYLNYHQPHANLAIAQVDPRLFEPWPPYAEFSELPREDLAIPKLEQAFSKVSEEFRRVVSECPPNEAVYCDLGSNTRVTSTITASEFDLILNNQDLNFYSTKPYGQWVAFVTHGDCYTAIPFFSPDELAATYGNGNQKCYYTIKLDLIY